MLAAVIAALSLAGQDPQAAPQSPPPQSQPVELEAVDATGRRLEDLVTGFVEEVAEPNRNRGLARWDGSICVGVANLRTEPAQYLTDRISTVAEDLGLPTGAPGCSPNLLIVATDDGNALARTLVDARAKAFRMGGSGMDRGGAALRDFQETERPVRWWQMAMPVDSETGQRATRIPGECIQAPCTDAIHMAPTISVNSPSRLRTQIVDNLFRTVVILDVDQVSDLTILQLADYIAMVSLAQVDPDADTTAYSTILNVFAFPDDAASLTDWDLAYLNGLYDAERNETNRRAGRREVVASIMRAHDDLRSEEPAAEPKADEE